MKTLAGADDVKHMLVCKTKILHCKGSLFPNSFFYKDYDKMVDD